MRVIAFTMGRYLHIADDSVKSIAPPRPRRYYLHMHSSLRDRPDGGIAAHRAGRESGRLVYPVVSRRSGGLSLGVNLFPDAKLCSFDCPYCEVFPIRDEVEGFSIAALEEELDDFLERGYPRDWAGESVRDICFSGNGEPSLSPFLGEAMELCARFKRSHPDILGSSALVLITNSTGFLESAVSELLEDAFREEGLVIWAKLDAGSERLFSLMSGTEGGLGRVAEGILSFSRRVRVVIQTMLCEVGGYAPSDEDVEDYSRLLARLIREGAGIEEVHLYTFARPCPGGSCAALGDDRLLERAARVRAWTGLRVRAFGSAAELPDAPKPGGIDR
jgi:wyosine [tRNA(Phe)-imidazoG37] synthetase (radical SAM superfamily)